MQKNFFKLIFITFYGFKFYLKFKYFRRKELLVPKIKNVWQHLEKKKKEL